MLLSRSAISTAALLLLRTSTSSSVVSAFSSSAFIGTKGNARWAMPRVTRTSTVGGTLAAAATESSSESSLTYLPSLSSLPSTYDAYLLDMWGVLHDGTSPYPGVLDAISRLKSQNKRLIVLSNSSKRIRHTTAMLTKLGFDPDDFEQIITSGEVSWRMLSGDDTLKCQTWPVLTDLIAKSEQNVFLFGSGDNDEEYCTTAGWALAPIEEADLILARGTFTLNDGSGSVVSKKADGEEAYFAEHDRVLQISAEKGIPMLVSNPDRVRPDEGLPPMPGAIGDAYERVLGGGKDVTIGECELVKRIGKPHTEVYELALGKSVCDDKNNINSTSTAIMVGDALETDIIGGKDALIDTLWVIKDGIHGLDVDDMGGYDGGGVEEMLVKFNKRKGYTNGDLVRPTYTMPNFRW